MATKKTSKKTPVSTYKNSYNYSKRPFWQWLVIYLVIGLVVYGLVYYFVFSPKGTYNYQSPKPTTQNSLYK